MKITTYSLHSFVEWQIGLTLELDKGTSSPAKEYLYVLRLILFLFKKEHSLSLHFKRNRMFNPEIIPKMLKKIKERKKESEAIE